MTPSASLPSLPDRPAAIGADTTAAVVGEGTAPRIAVVFATRGRAEVLRAVVDRLGRQTLRPTTVIVSCVGPDDAAGLAGQPDVTVLFGPPGLPAQRNTALAHLGRDVDLVVFFDDDFVAHDGWLDAVARVFADRPDVGIVTGHVIADDIKGPGFGFAEAVGLVAGHRPPKPWVRENYSPYGCNMAFRRTAMDGLAFDERLIRYGWLEDRDFGAAVIRRGYRAVKISDAVGVHMGVKRSRVPGEMLGYSQVVNPLYLFRKGTMSGRDVAHHIGKNMAANLLHFLRPEAFVDRRGRLRGNLAGLRDVLRGQVEPERAERL